jgi:hypothetical protein
MTQESPEHEPTFGYLSAVETAEHGYFGGYLIVSAIGRPLEFHCTAPVLPSRAQQILYGPALHPYLIGDQIGGTLLDAAKHAPRVILTNQGDMVGLRARSRVPLVLLLEAFGVHQNTQTSLPAQGDNNAASGQSAVATHEEHRSWGHPFLVRSQRLQLPLGYESDQETVVALLTILSERVELLEPFDRIYEAIREAQRIGGRGSDAHGHAA